MSDSNRFKVAVMAMTMAVLCSETNAFSAVRHTNAFSLSASSALYMSQSYEFDSDEASEQILAEKEEGENVERHFPPANGGGKRKTQLNDLLSDVGLAGELSSLDNLPENPQVSTNGVFCNRELNLGGIRAIGFDMDYTLAQYKQPAFDQLAFDGAKEKLVHNFGYPASLLDVEYDHTVRDAAIVNFRQKSIHE